MCVGLLQDMTVVMGFPANVAAIMRLFILSMLDKIIDIRAYQYYSASYCAVC